ncbi:hypothetical protein PC123_g16013 [Phytophthora cactorum]|nr:hypothetical protein PC123_g16013 [Phytophthora cactorum]
MEAKSTQEKEYGVAQPIFTPVLPPAITSTSHAALIAVEDVEDGRLRNEFDSIINSVKNHTLPDVQALFKRELHFDLKGSDVSERVLQHFMSCDRITEQHGLQACFDSDTGMKEKCSLLINSITLESLKEEIKNALRYQSPEAKTNECKLHDLILAKALKQDRQFRRSKWKRTSEVVPLVRQSQGGNNKKAERKVEPVRHDERQDKSNARKSDSSIGSRKLSNQDTRYKSAAAVPEKGCLKCGDPHWVSKCPQATDSEKRELPKQYHKNKGKSSETNMKRLREEC